MKKIIFLFSIIFLLNGCVESIALLGSSAGGASSGKLFQSSLQSSISYGIKKQTGKTPLGHALAYADKVNPENKKERCISSIEKTNSEICMIVKKQLSTSKSSIKKKISSTQANIKEKVQVVLGKHTEIKNEGDNLNKSKKLSRDFTLKKNSEVKIQADNIDKIKESTKKFVLVIKSKIDQYDARWLNRIERSRNLRSY